MIELENLEKYPSSNKTYGGNSGSKKGILINNERWLLKFPKSTKSMDVVGLSYTTTPLSEYLGSKIYETLGIETHETKLGLYDNKLVVACKDFLTKDETFLDYHSIKNEFNNEVEEALENLSSSLSSLSNFNTNLEELNIVMENNPFFKNNKELRNRFWDMFVVDAFINNNDRNDGNWGLILNNTTNKLKLAPIFDNGASFYNKLTENKIIDYLNNSIKFQNVVYDSSISIFQLNNKSINPLKFLEKCDNVFCNEAILRIVPKIDLKKIKNIFDEIPEKFNDIQIFSLNQKEFYLKMLEYRYENILKPAFDCILNVKKQ